MDGGSSGGGGDRRVLPLLSTRWERRAMAVAHHAWTQDPKFISEVGGEGFREAYRPNLNLLKICHAYICIWGGLRISK